MCAQLVVKPDIFKYTCASYSHKMLNDTISTTLAVCCCLIIYVNCLKVYKIIIYMSTLNVRLEIVY